MCSRPWQILITSELWAHSIKSIGSFFSGGYEAERPIKKTHHLSLSPLPDMGSALAVHWRCIGGKDSDVDQHAPDCFQRSLTNRLPEILTIARMENLGGCD